MKLILMRHAEAEPAGAGQDSERALTTEGQAMARRMGKLLLDTGWKLREIRHSPLVRTTQTAQHVSEAFATRPDVISEKRLAPGSGPGEATELLSNADPNDVLLWVLHAPDIAGIAAFLTGASATGYFFSPGTMLALMVPPAGPGSALQVWHLPPEYLPR